MRNSFVADSGLKLVRSPSARQQAGRRWLTIAFGVVLLALGGAVIGALTTPATPAAATGPFSYFPS